MYVQNVHKLCITLQGFSVKGRHKNGHTSKSYAPKSFGVSKMRNVQVDRAHRAHRSSCFLFLSFQDGRTACACRCRASRPRPRSCCPCSRPRACSVPRCGSSCSGRTSPSTLSTSEPCQCALLEKKKRTRGFENETHSSAMARPSSLFPCAVTLCTGLSYLFLGLENFFSGKDERVKKSFALK